MANDQPAPAAAAPRLPLVILVVTAVAGGIFGAILAFAIASAGRWPLPASDPAIADLSFRVEGVEALVPQIDAAYNSALNNAQASATTQARLQEIDALLRTDLDALKDQTLRAFSNAYYAQERAVGQVADRAEAVASTLSTAEGAIAGLTERLAALEARPATDPAVTGEIAELRAALAELQAAPPPPTDPAVVGEIAALGAALTALRAAPAPAIDPAVTAELSALRDALAELGAAQTALAVRLKTLETAPSGAAIPAFAPVGAAPAP
jgi:hypothetical protein